MKNKSEKSAFTLVILFTICLVISIIVISKHNKEVELLQNPFVLGCVAEGVDIEICDCIYNKILDTYGVDGYLQIAKDYENNGEINDSVLDEINECFE